MPKIQWTNLPSALRQRLFDRLEEGKITAEDLYQLKLWRESEPDAPEGPWYKDFGTFKLCGHGKFPKTFLLKGQAAEAKLFETKSDRTGCSPDRLRRLLVLTSNHTPLCVFCDSAANPLPRVANALRS